MTDIAGYFIVLLSGVLFFTFPGVLFVRFFPAIDTLSKKIVTIFTSIGFWVCSSWFISLLHLPLSITALSILSLFTIAFFITKRKKNVKDAAGDKKVQLHHIILSLFLLLYIAPLLFITIPPGCDTAMHGYISRLIVNVNGLPHSYRPILPVDYFGSYSAGYHVMTALTAGVHEANLRLAINFMSIIVYPLTLLGFIFLLRRFFSEQTAIYTSIIFFGINNTIEGAIGWGGNPSVMAFAFCLFSIGLVIYAIQQSAHKALLCAAITVAAIPLIHAIPAVAFAYLSVAGFILLLFHYRDRAKWIVTNMAILVVLILLLLFPFLLHFKNDSTPELLSMIKHWQQEMMGNKAANNIAGNTAITLEQIKYRTGDVLVILSGISLAVMLYYKRWRTAIYVFIFIVLLFVLILNYTYWVLPLSELLYPERVVYFMIICLSFFLADLLTILETKGFAVGKKIKVYSIVVTAGLCLSTGMVFSNYMSPIRNNNISCDVATRKAFDWINTNTEKDALFVASYADAGMWIPTFTNRATLGTHIHFIHHVQHVNDSLNVSKGPRYYFVTNRDKATKTAVMDSVVGKTMVYSNDAVMLYK